MAAPPAALQWRGDHLAVIDQTLLPDRVEWRELRTADDVVDAIRRLVVRGAPLIGACGAWGVVLGLREGKPVSELVTTIGRARPTARNLGWAVERVAAAAARGVRPDAEAARIQAEDEEACRRMGEHGRMELAGRRRILTHCNTGRLATCGIGTALGVVYAKALAGEPVEVLATETRPSNQGARLTTWELADAGIPCTLITDAAAGLALHSGRVDAVVVGCDRVATNGDVANKIGTHTLAVLADTHHVPFYVCGPLSSFDPEIFDGSAITLEERSPDEIAPGALAWNPVFDVTPAGLVTAFVTDAGVLRPPYDASIPEALSGRDAARTAT